MEHTAKLALIDAIQPEIAPMTDQVTALLQESISKISDQWGQLSDSIEKIAP